MAKISFYGAVPTPPGTIVDLDAPEVRRVIAGVLWPHCPMRMPLPTEPEIDAWADHMAGEVLDALRDALNG